MEYILGIITAYIAYIQWLTEENKRQQFLFDKRYDFYKKLRGRYFSLDDKEEAGYSDCLDAEDLNELEYQAKWLFGADMSKAIESMHGRKLNLCDRAANTLPEDIENIFYKYMQIEKPNIIRNFFTKLNQSKLKSFIIFVLSFCIVSNCYAGTSQKNKVDKLNYDLALCESFLKNANTTIYNKESLTQLYDAFNILDKYWYKGEFETTEEFKKREGEEKTKLYKQIQNQLNSEYVVYSHKMDYESQYDADSKVFKIHHFYIWRDQGEKLDVKLLQDGYKEYTEKQNAYGAKILVNSSKGKEFIYSYILPDKVTPKNSDWPREDKEISLDVEKAKNLKENLHLLIIAKISDVSFKSEYREREATFDRPYEYSFKAYKITLNPLTACYYNADTKEVYSLDND